MTSVNPPQHIFGQSPLPTPADYVYKARPTGPGTAPADLDVADPHPADEGEGGSSDGPIVADAVAKDIGPNPAVHDGSPPTRPHNAGSGPA
jgi:hypothetical protein